MNVWRIRTAAACAWSAGLGATCGVAGAAEPAGVNVLPLRAVFHEDVRVLWFGDSYALPYASRVSGASILSWRIDSWTAFTMGDGPNWFHVFYDLLAPGLVTIDTANTYRLYQTGPEDDVQYALPLWRLREYRHPEGVTAATDLIRYRARRTPPSVGFVGEFGVEGDTANVRPILLDPPGPPTSVERLRLTTAGVPAFEFDPRAESRPKRLSGLDPSTDAPVAPADGQVFAAPVDLPAVINAADELEFTLSVGDTTGAGGYVFPAGFTAYRTDHGVRRPGLHFSALTDGSWSYEGFGLDTPSGTPGVISKTYTREQLAHYLDATTIDPAQPLMAFYLVNVEDIEAGEAAVFMERMVNQTAAAAADAGLGPVHHCIVIPWKHRIEGADIPGRHEEQRDVAFALAAGRADVSAVSIHDFTDAVWFDGNPQSQQWLIDHGYDSFTYGDITVDLTVEGGGPGGGLLDVFRSHPASQNAGAFFAHVIERVIVDACPADFRPPWGVLDLADIGGFLTGFLEERPSSDMADPVGVWDLADLSAFIASFSAGCGR